jgi:hypothetical protein
MATPLASSLPVTVQFREQYVSQALNAKMQAIPRGIVRGAILRPTATNNEFTIAVDPLTGDTVINAVGVAGLASGTGDDYVVTFRSTANLNYTAVGVTGTLNFIYFLPGYTATATTNAQIISYDQSEFENGDPDAAGGVLLGVVVANTSGVLTSDRIIYSGMSNGVTGATKRVPFRRHNCENFAGGQGYRPIRERVASRMDFGYKAGTRVPFSLQVGVSAAPDFQSGSTVFAYSGAISSPIGTGALRYAPAGSDLINTTVLLYGDAFDVPQGTTYPKKLRFEIIYRTVGVFTGSVIPLVYYVGSTGGAASPLVPPTYAPSSLPIADNTDWSLYVLEYDLQVGVSLSSVMPQVVMGVTGGEVQLASVTCIFSEPSGVSSALEYGASGALTVPASYGTLALPASLHQSTALSSAVSVLQVKDAVGATTQQKGWRVGNVPSQFYDPSALPAGPNLYFVPETNLTTSKLQIGYATAQDVETATLEARYASVEVLGNGEGSSASYSVTLNNTPIKVDEIRPNNGFGANANRIDVRNTDGTLAVPTYFSSSGTAAATCVVQYDGANWNLIGSAANFVNIASVATVVGNVVRFTFASPLQAATTSVPSAIYYGQGVNFWYPNVVTFTTALCDIGLIDPTGTYGLASGDRIYFTVIGRIA